MGVTYSMRGKLVLNLLHKVGRGMENIGSMCGVMVWVGLIVGLH